MMRVFQRKWIWFFPIFSIFVMIYATHNKTFISVVRTVIAKLIRRKSGEDKIDKPTSMRNIRSTKQTKSDQKEKLLESTTQQQLIPTDLSEMVTFSSTHKSKLPTMLLWYPPPFLERRYGGKIIVDNLEKCGGCTFTNDKSKLNESEIIILHSNFLERGGSIPKSRFMNQTYVFYTQESPYHTNYLGKNIADLKNYDNLFNMTMTYRRDSDVMSAYGCWGERFIEKVQRFPLKPNRPKLAVMFASSCNKIGAKLRKEYSDMLIQNGLRLDRYGKCFGNYYNGSMDGVLMQYKFFMSFENSIHCRDYITEKFWLNSLEHGLLPVVIGPHKEDIKSVAPPHSYIHAEDFKSPKDLVNYLNYLDKNDTAYKEYFKWREIPPPHLKYACGKGTEFCVLCKKYMEGSRGKTFSISKWWYGEERTECFSTVYKKTKSYFSKIHGL
ncbi:4-galactosyl-N-acetylglucosaminide 3-alpha-L-fucosyltransferase FUT6-like isoform X1 [Styela clava]